MKFVHRFSHSVSWEMIVSDEPPSKGESHIQELKWTSRPKPKHIAQYRQWGQSTAILAQRWKQQILYGLGVSSTSTELWAFEPGQPPKLVEKLQLGIP
jgi:hypothetical protein